jgi:hypothetical protein
VARRPAASGAFGSSTDGRNRQRPQFAELLAIGGIDSSSDGSIHALTIDVSSRIFNMHPFVNFRQERLGRGIAERVFSVINSSGGHRRSDFRASEASSLQTQHSTCIPARFREGIRIASISPRPLSEFPDGRPIGVQNRGTFRRVVPRFGPTAL